MKLLAAIVSVLALAGPAAQAAPSGQPLLTLDSQVVSWGLTMPIPPVASVIVATVGKARQPELDACLAKQRLQPHDYKALLLAWSYRAAPGHRMHLVRASPRYCGVFYDRDDFIYYVVDERSGGGRPPSFNIVHIGRGSRVSVLPTVSNGLSDIEAAGCKAGKCRIARQAFDGRQYRAVQCEESTIRGKRETRAPRRCGSDGFPDNQVPPAVPRPKR